MERKLVSNFSQLPRCSIRFHPVPFASGAKEKLARHWDPLTMSYGGGAGLPSDAIELPTELMMMPGASSEGFCVQLWLYLTIIGFNF